MDEKRRLDGYIQDLTRCSEWLDALLLQSSSNAMVHKTLPFLFLLEGAPPA